MPYAIRRYWNPKIALWSLAGVPAMQAWSFLVMPRLDSSAMVFLTMGVAMLLPIAAARRLIGKNSFVELNIAAGALLSMLPGAIPIIVRTPTWDGIAVMAALLIALVAGIVWCYAMAVKHDKVRTRLLAMNG